MIGLLSYVLFALAALCDGGGGVCRWDQERREQSQRVTCTAQWLAIIPESSHCTYQYCMIRGLPEWPHAVGVSGSQWDGKGCLAPLIWLGMVVQASFWRPMRARGVQPQCVRCRPLGLESLYVLCWNEITLALSRHERPRISWHVFRSSDRNEAQMQGKSAVHRRPHCALNTRTCIACLTRHRLGPELACQIPAKWDQVLPGVGRLSRQAHDYPTPTSENKRSPHTVLYQVVDQGQILVYGRGGQQSRKASPLHR